MDITGLDYFKYITCAYKECEKTLVKMENLSYFMDRVKVIVVFLFS